jgi:hypothetical protein
MNELFEFGFEINYLQGFKGVVRVAD